MDEKGWAGAEIVYTCLSNFISFSLWIFASSFANSGMRGDQGAVGEKSAKFVPSG